ncbi:MAG: hypothetical protein EZS28_040297 [Streblomastix strix]|uniref:Uncharacterized protein n=1 Tax=Streblomastix strix TaxID=222440 RepID=A0A5J4U0E6_9EUKA|nr:MAG: hypothetical protein EZS28_040297 [Streblomastix strix]
MSKKQKSGNKQKNKDKEYNDDASDEDALNQALNEGILRHLKGRSSPKGADLVGDLMFCSYIDFRDLIGLLVQFIIRFTLS